MANAVMIAGTFLSMLPRSESPEATDGRYGFYCPIEVTGSIGKAEIELIIRDFDIQEVERRAAYLGDLAKTVEGAYPGSRVSVETEKQYLNMKEVLDRYPELVEKLTAAVRAAGMDVRLKEIRGGTDGARLTEMGLPAPNIFTGGHNYHGKYEWIALPSMVKAARTLINLLRLWAE
jgi:tripeptide aminopeptidase